MSFWLFTNALNNHNQLQKYLDSFLDVSATSTSDFVEDPVLLQELVSELENIKGNYSSHSGFQLLQQLQNQDSVNNGNNPDNYSVSSSNNESVNTSNKDTRNVKLIELLLQPHILNGLLDYIIASIDYFYDLQVKEDEEVSKIVNSNGNNSKEEGSNIDSELEDDNQVEIEQAEQSLLLELQQKEQEESESQQEKMRRCVQVSSDILSVDLWMILNRIIETPSIISKLWQILSHPHLIEGLPTVSYVIRIFDQLMDTNSIELLNFIRRQDDLVDTILKKIEVPLIMEFALRVIQTDKATSPTGIVDVLSQQQLVPRLIDILKPPPSQFESNDVLSNTSLYFKQTAATDFIKALITISSNTALAVVLETNIGPNQLTRELVSPKIMKTMIYDIILYQPPSNTNTSGNKILTNKHGINNCVGIIIELIRKNNSDYDLNCGNYCSLFQNDANDNGEINSYMMFQWLRNFEHNPPSQRDPLYLGEMLLLFSENLDKLTNIMKAETDNLTSHVADSKTLGFSKFKIAELIAELLHCSNMILLNSKKIRKVIQVRDKLRLEQGERLRKALNETFVNSDDDLKSPVHDITNGLDDVSLDGINFVDGSTHSEQDQSRSKSHISDDESSFISMLENIENEPDSEDEEPKISPENPFVCDERDKSTRANPCVGDLFKIRLADLGILIDIISKFTKYPWHNFFHNVVFDLIQQIFNGKLNSYNSFLIKDLFEPKKCDLINMIVSSYKSVPTPRPGYMGHMILISEEVVKFTSLYKPDLISPVIVNAIQSSDWEWFVNEMLLKTREIYNVVLGADDDEEEDEYDGKRKGNSYDFDSSTVGYLDLENYDNTNEGHGDRNMIILGDKNNHEAFVNDRTHSKDTKDTLDEDENMEESEVPDVRLSQSHHLHDMSEREVLDGYDNNAFGGTYHDNDFLDDLAGSSSSDDEDVDDIDDDEGGNNELRRVSRHNE